MSHKPSQEPPDASNEARGYSLRNILATLPAATPSALVSSLSSLPTEACFSKAFYWGIGVGTLLGVHRLKQGGSIRQATNAVFIGSFATFGTQWYLCRQQEYDRKLALRAFYAQQQQIQAGFGTNVVRDPADPAYRDGPAPPR